MHITKMRKKNEETRKIKAKKKKKIDEKEQWTQWRQNRAVAKKSEKNENEVETNLLWLIINDSAGKFATRRGGGKRKSESKSINIYISIGISITSENFHEFEKGAEIHETKKTEHSVNIHNIILPSE